MLRYYLLFGIYFLCCFKGLHAQVFNNFTNVNTSPGTTLFVNGSSYNDTTATLIIDASGSSAELITNDLVNNGILEGSGHYRIKGNWFNNHIYNAGTGIVSMEGGSQIIGGNNSTLFYNLSLLGTGNKTQTNNHFVLNTLDLTDKELLTEFFSMSVLNTDINAIQRTTGFVSSIDTGYLARKTALTGIYLYPVGSSIGSTRYRPVEIEPETNDTNIYNVRMANTDATTEGFDRSLVSNTICQTNPLFYHRINRSSGISDAHIHIFYNEGQDGVWDGIAHWTPSPLWEIAAGTTTMPGNPLSKATISNWNNFSQTPYILYLENISVDLGPDTLICGNTTLALNAGAGFDNYIWSTSETTAAISISTTGVYSVTVTKGLCTYVDSISITINPNPVIDLGNDTTVCNSAIIRLDAGTGFASYLWSTADTTQFIDISTAGTYSVTVSDFSGCLGFGTITISTISYNASIDHIGDLCHDATPVTLTAADIGGVWSGTGISDPVNGIFEPILAGIGQHTITYTISLPCGDTGTIVVNVINCDPYEPHAVVPDIFSPNGDGENDILFVRGEGIKSLYFAVYTRWGEKVFDTTDKNIGWNGTYKDKALDPAVFVYHLFVLLENNKEIKIKGDVTLVR